MIFHLKILPVLLAAFQVATNNHGQYRGILLVDASNGHARETSATTRLPRNQGDDADVDPITPKPEEPIAVDDMGVVGPSLAETAVVDIANSAEVADDQPAAQVILPEEEEVGSDLAFSEVIAATEEDDDNIVPRQEDAIIARKGAVTTTTTTRTQRRRDQVDDVTATPSDTPSASAEPSNAPSNAPSDSNAPSPKSSEVPSGVPSMSAEPSFAPSDRLRITTGHTAAELIAELIGTAGDIVTRNIVDNPHLMKCAGIFSNGNSMGTLFEKDAEGTPILKNGQLVPSTTNVIPDQGLILSTGEPIDFFFNDDNQTSTNFSESLNLEQGLGDPDLVNAIESVVPEGTLCENLDDANGEPFPLTVFDNCVLEFEFKCANTNEDIPDQVVFNYVFGSEEYHEFVKQDFNDVFGFYLNSDNIALVKNTPRPGTQDPTDDKVIVAINSINRFRNKPLYNGNNVDFNNFEDEEENEQEPDFDDPRLGALYPLIEADGFTNTFEAIGNSRTTENDGWNTMKLAVGDTCDEILDSWVLLERNSFVCRQPTVEPSEAPSLVPSTSLVPTKGPTASPTASPTTAAPTVSPTTAEPTTSPTKAPSTSPTMSPTTLEPTASPSSLPSQQPSIIIQSIVIEGAVSISFDICSMTATQQASFQQATIDALNGLTACTQECLAEITTFCENNRRLKTSSSRVLQEAPDPEDFQLEFRVTETFTCEIAACTSTADVATADSIVDGTVTPLRSSFTTTDFEQRLGTSLLATGDFAPDVIECFAAWGLVESPALDVTPPTDDGRSLPVLWYPDWEFDSGTCLRNGENAPRYMQLDPDSWLYTDLAGCCERYFGGWNENACNNPNGSGLWYVSHPLELCVTDCRVGDGQFCGGLAQDISDDLYAHPRTCCQRDLPWRFIEHCEAFSLQDECYRGTMKYHRGDNEGWPIKSNVCVRDCDPVRENNESCGGLVEDTYIELWDTAEECCAEHHEWMNPELCVARSNVVPLNKWWPDKINSLCVLDSVTPTDELSIAVYNSTAECCSEAINWLSVADCRARSGDTTVLAATNLYYIDWGREVCVQDCEGDPPCVGLGEAQPWDERYVTAAECCSVLDWIPRRECFGVGVTAS